MSRERSVGRDVRLSKIGYNLYSTVREGWPSYLDDPKTVNQQNEPVESSDGPETFAEVGEVQKRLIETAASRHHGVGTMSGERWENAIIGQIKELKTAFGCRAKLG